MHLFWRTAILAAGVSLLLFVFRDVDILETGRRIARLWPFLPLILSFYLLGSLCDTAAWSILLQDAHATVSFRRLLLVHLAGESFYRFLPAGVVIGESVKVALLSGGGHLPVPRILSSLIARKILMGIAQAVYIGISASLGILLFSSDQPVWIHRTGGIVSMVLLTVFIIAGAVVRRGDAGIALMGWLSRFPVRPVRFAVLRHRSSFAEMDRHLSGALSGDRRRLWRSTGLFFLGWWTELLESWVILALLVPLSATLPVLVFEPVVSLLRSVAFVMPGGLGVMDLGYASSLGAIPSATAASLIATFIILKRIKELFWVIVGVSITAIVGSGSVVIEEERQENIPEVAV